MTARKLEPTQYEPQFVSREVGAALLCISPTTWDELVKKKKLPKPEDLDDDRPGALQRWDWRKVRSYIAERKEAMQGSVVDMVERVRENSRKAAEAGR